MSWFAAVLSDQYLRGLARLEIDGQTPVIGANDERVFEAPCDRRSSLVGSALLDIQVPLAVRWQTLDDPARWHEASVSVPAFQGPISRDMQASLRNVPLYFWMAASLRRSSSRHRVLSGDVRERSPRVSLQA